MKLRTNISNSISKKFIFHFLISLTLLSSYSVYGKKEELECSNLCIFGILIVSLLLISGSFGIWFYYRNKTSFNGGKISEKQQPASRSRGLSDDLYGAAEKF